MFCDTVTCSRVCPHQIKLHWVPLTTSNYIHRNRLAVYGAHYDQFLTLMLMTKIFSQEKSACYSRVLVLIAFVMNFFLPDLSD